MTDVPQSSMDWTNEGALDDCRRTCQGDDPPDAVFVIANWNANHRYETRFWNCGLSITQAIALLEIEKQKLIRMMGPKEVP